MKKYIIINLIRISGNKGKNNKTTVLYNKNNKSEIFQNTSNDMSKMNEEFFDPIYDRKESPNFNQINDLRAFKRSQTISMINFTQNKKALNKSAAYFDYEIYENDKQNASFQSKYFYTNPCEKSIHETSVK